MTVTNTGKRASDEVVQLYIHDVVSSVTRPVQELKGFRRIHLAPGESKQVDFPLGFDELVLLRREDEARRRAGALRGDGRRQLRQREEGEPRRRRRADRLA